MAGDTLLGRTVVGGTVVAGWVLFIKGDGWEANKQLREALRLGLDESSELEAQFYLLAHTAADPEVVFKRIGYLASRGARLAWDVRLNIEEVGHTNREKASLIRAVQAILAGDKDAISHEAVTAQWSR